MDHAEVMAKIERLTREREALEASYADFMAESENHSPPEDPRERATELEALLKRMANVEMEHEQNVVLSGLLLDAYMEVIKAYEG